MVHQAPSPNEVRAWAIAPKPVGDIGAVDVNCGRELLVIESRGQVNDRGACHQRREMRAHLVRAAGTSEQLRRPTNAGNRLFMGGDRKVCLTLSSRGSHDHDVTETRGFGQILRYEAALKRRPCLVVPGEELKIF